jgi:hypothetical protein
MKTVSPIEYVRDYLIQQLNKRPDLDGKGTSKYGSLHEYILQNGRPCYVRTTDTEAAVAYRCYDNASALVDVDPLRYLYYEGFTVLFDPAIDAIVSAPFQHAWVYDLTTDAHLCPTVQANRRHPESIDYGSSDLVVIGLGHMFPAVASAEYIRRGIDLARRIYSFTGVASHGTFWASITEKN